MPANFSCDGHPLHQKQVRQRDSFFRLRKDGVRQHGQLLRRRGRLCLRGKSSTESGKRVLLMLVDPPRKELRGILLEVSSVTGSIAWLQKNKPAYSPE